MNQSEKALWWYTASGLLCGLCGVLFLFMGWPLIASVDILIGLGIIGDALREMNSQSHE